MVMSLLLILIQDLKSRAVYWIIFPLLLVALLLLRLLQQFYILEILHDALINIGFLMLQLLIITLYFSVKTRKRATVIGEMLGWGDILFLIVIAFYLSALNFLFFYIVSLVGSLLLWLLWRLFSSEKNPHIPLAGFQSLIFILFLAGDWWLKYFNLTSDVWLLNLINK